MRPGDPAQSERGTTRTRPYPNTIRALAGALGVSAPDRSALIAAVPTRRRESTAVERVLRTRGYWTDSRCPLRPFDDGVDTGRAMSIDEAVAFAASGITDAG